MNETLDAKKYNSSSNEDLTPFLRWAGGKRRLVPLITSLFPGEFNGKENRYFEPFIGGGSLMLALGNKNGEIYVPGKNIYFNDSNPDLINTYKTIRDDVELLIDELEDICFSKTKNQFEKIKKWEPDNQISGAARFIYLNKTCFNGLWRVNASGHFNVPWGKLKNPKIYSEVNLRSISSRLQGSTITNQSYISSLEKAKSGDVVYLDPPYLPLSSSSSFSNYSKHGFGVLDHFSLAGLVRGLTEIGAHVILSNSNTPLSREIFGPSLYLYKLDVRRSISANSESRKKVSEIVGTNFELDLTEFNQELKSI